MSETTSETEEIQNPQGSATPGQLMREIYFPTYIYFKDLANGTEINEIIKLLDLERIERLAEDRDLVDLTLEGIRDLEC